MCVIGGDRRRFRAGVVLLAFAWIYFYEYGRLRMGSGH